MNEEILFGPVPTPVQVAVKRSLHDAYKVDESDLFVELLKRLDALTENEG